MQRAGHTQTGPPRFHLETARAGHEPRGVLTDEADDGAPAKSPEPLGGVHSAFMATYWPGVEAAWQ
jgi:hypothetical protein